MNQRIFQYLLCWQALRAIIYDWLNALFVLGRTRSRLEKLHLEYAEFVRSEFGLVRYEIPCVKGSGSSRLSDRWFVVFGLSYRITAKPRMLGRCVRPPRNAPLRRIVDRLGWKSNGQHVTAVVVERQQVMLSYFSVAADLAPRKHSEREKEPPHIVMTGV